MLKRSCVGKKQNCLKNASCVVESIKKVRATPYIVTHRLGNVFSSSALFFLSMNFNENGKGNTRIISPHKDCKEGGRERDEAVCTFLVNIYLGG